MFHSHIFIQAFLNSLRQFGRIEVQMMRGDRKACNHRPGTTPLVSALAESCRIGKTAIVEYVKCIQPFYIYFQSVKTFGVIVGYVIKAVRFMDPVVVAGAAIENIHP